MSGAIEARVGAFFTPGRFLALATVINMLNYLDRGIIPGAFENVGHFITQELHVHKTDVYIGGLQVRDRCCPGGPVCWPRWREAARCASPGAIVCAAGVCGWVGRRRPVLVCLAPDGAAVSASVRVNACGAVVAKRIVNLLPPPYTHTFDALVCPASHALGSLAWECGCRAARVRERACLRLVSRPYPVPFAVVVHCRLRSCQRSVWAPGALLPAVQAHDCRPLVGVWRMWWGGRGWEWRSAAFWCTLKCPPPPLPPPTPFPQLVHVPAAPAARRSAHCAGVGRVTGCARQQDCCAQVVLRVSIADCFPGGPL